MNRLIKLLAIAATVSLTSLTLQARDTDESMLMLKEAMMDSNADYNKHKKKANHDEFDRVEKWGRRDTGTIVIDGKVATQSDINEYQVAQDKEVREDREISAVIEEDKD